MVVELETGMDTDTKYSYVLTDTASMIGSMVGELSLETYPSLNILVHGVINLLSYEH